MLTVTCEKHQDSDLYGLYIGEERETFSAACRLAEKKNITWLSKRAKKVVAWLDPAEFGSTWVGNKAVYRTRMMIADGGELLILAPGIKSFGENEEVDVYIRKYGYSGTKKIQDAYENGEFNGIEMAAAHLIHGSSNGRFKITYATDPELMPEETMRSVGYEWTDIGPMMEKYQPREKETGWYEDQGEEYYFIKAPALGLWRVLGEE